MHQRLMSVGMRVGMHVFRIGQSQSLGSAGRSKAACTPLCFIQSVDLDDVGHRDPLQDELGDAVADVDLELAIAKIEEDDADLAAVIGVDDAGADVDAVLDGEAGARGDAAVAAGRDAQAQPRLDDGAAARRHGGGLRGVQVQPRGVRRAAGRQLRARPGQHDVQRLRGALALRGRLGRRRRALRGQGDLLGGGRGLSLHGGPGRGREAAVGGAAAEGWRCRDEGGDAGHCRWGYMAGGGEHGMLAMDGRRTRPAGAVSVLDGGVRFWREIAAVRAKKCDLVLVVAVVQ